MKRLWLLAIQALVVPQLFASGMPKQDPMCTPLRAFAKSVEAGQTHTIEFHTVWGGDFESVAARSLYATQCIDHGYQPAKAVCSFLIQHGAIEFPGNNAISAVSCLSPGTRFAHLTSLDRLELSFDLGTPNHGSTVTVSYGPASKMRGMVMLIKAEGY